MLPNKASVLISLTIIFEILTQIESKFYKNNVTDFSKCKVYYSQSGSIYKDFFEILDEPQNGTLLDFHFSVLASSDAHILLAPSRNVDKADPVYEIVIGAGGNTFCDIRRMQKSMVKATVRVKGLLSALDVHSFWIHMSRDGVIDVGKEGEELAFLSWIDPDPLPLTVFSFSTWPGVEAKWFFDCVRDENDGNSTKKLQRELTPLEKLRRDYLFRYDPYVRPVANDSEMSSEMTEVGMSLETSYISLNEYRSIMEFRGTIKLTWNDSKLVWNPANYSGVDEMHIFRREIWVPELFHYNSAEFSEGFLEDTLIVVNSSGFATLKAQANLNSWCSLEDLGNWPRDEHSCLLIVGYFKDMGFIEFNFHVNQSKFISPFSSRWQVKEFKVFSTVSLTFNETSDNNTFIADPPGLRLHFQLKRTSNSLSVVLFTPFFVIAIALLVTFWTSPFGPWKISLICLQLIVCSIILLAIAYLMPTQSRVSPNILLLYSFTLVAILLCLVLETVVINLSRIQKTLPPPHLVTQILTSGFLKIFLCLPESKSPVQYGKLSESSPSRLEGKEQNMWILLGVAIDRIAFFVYLSVCMYAFHLTY